MIDAVGESRPNHEVFRELGARLGLSDADDEIGEAGALIDTLPRIPEALAAALGDGKPAAGPADGRPVQFVDVHPKTPDGRVHLHPAALASERSPYQYAADPATAAFPLALISPASEHTISSTLGELRPGVARVKIHPDDAHARSIDDGVTVRVFNDLGEVHCEASVTPETRVGTVSLPKGLWAKSTLNGSTEHGARARHGRRALGRGVLQRRASAGRAARSALVVPGFRGSEVPGFRGSVLRYSRSVTAGSMRAARRDGCHTAARQASATATVAPR